MSAITASPLPQHLSAAASSSVGTPRPPRTRPSPSDSPSQGSPRSSSPRNHTSNVLDVEAVMRNCGGDVRKAMDALLSERNALQSQNTQLWKLIEKQRAQCAHLLADNERLRADRERANGRLAAAGLEPVAGKRIANSSSAVGLGLRPDAPQIRRNNSDRDEKIVAKQSLDVPRPADSAPASPGDRAAGVLLPSPMKENKLRRESRMTFPPEVSSFMSLAESPREAHHTIPPLPTSLSPAPQATAAQLATDQAAVPPTSQTLDAVVEQDEPPTASRSPMASILKSPTTSSFRDPPRMSEDRSRASMENRRSEDASRQSEDATTPRQSVDQRALLNITRSGSTPRLAPALLPHTRLSIPHSTVYPNAAGRDVLCFIVSITIRPPNAQPMSWTVAKLFSAFIDLDTRIKARAGKSRKDWKSMVAPLPDGKAWKDFAPSKIDQRKVALEAYIQSLLVAPISDKSDLCEFLSTDPVQAKQDAVRKEGYLTKKGKNFGGWRTRYFVLDGPVMEYYESRGGAHLGSISVTNAQIGRQNRPSDSYDDRDFRHAFLIIEAAKKGTSNRHVLCADSDLERDSWIEVLVRHVDPEPTPLQTRRRSDSRKSSKDVVVTAALPMAALMAGGTDPKFAGAPSPSVFNNFEMQRNQASTSSPSIASQSSLPSYASQDPAQNIETLRSPPSQPLASSASPAMEMMSPSPPADSTPRAKRQSTIPPRSTSSHAHSAAYLSKLSQDGMSAPPGYVDKERERKAKSGRFWPSFGKTVPERVTRPVFAVPLADSIAIAGVANLPAIVFRCIEWLEVKHAEQEEGIYRLSGSSAVIKGLKDRFDAEGDVNLVALDDHWDPHAIAGLLKTFLRDLPTSLLTRELHPRFLAVMDLIDSSARVTELSRLVSELPPPNYALLRALTAHLILIVKHSLVNKMTLRNIGIVFSPTLGIPAGIFSELVSHFGTIFDDEPMTPAEEAGNGGALAVEPPAAKRNSILYLAGGADVMLGLGGRTLDPTMDDTNSEASADVEADVDVEDSGSEAASAPSSENLSAAQLAAASTPRAEGNPSAAAVRKAKAAAKGGEVGFTLEPPTAAREETLKSPRKVSGGNGLPVSPRSDRGKAERESRESCLSKEGYPSRAV